jgi:hypothetical protein
MSYDLYFYKRKEIGVTKSQIAEYLNQNLTSENEGSNQWFFQNEDPAILSLPKHK